MKAIFNVIRANPQSIEEVISEDIDILTITDNVVHMTFNDGTKEIIRLRANDGEHDHEWRGISVFVTRKSLEVDMAK